MNDPALLVSVLAGIFTLYSLGSSISKAWTARKSISKIPTIGPSGILSSYIGAYRYLFHGRDMIQEGYDKYHGAVFKVPLISKWMIVVSGLDKIEDIRKATDDQLSFRDAVADSIQIEYTMGPEIRHDHYHVAVVRSPLTRNLAARFPDVQDEIAIAFAEHIPPTAEWKNVVALPTIMKIVCRSSNRLFVGLPLCRNPDYRIINQEFTIDVIKAAQTINLFPNFLKPIVGRILTKVPSSIKRAAKHLRPIVEERLEKEAQYGPDWPDKPNDLISWLLDNAQGTQRSVRDVTIRVLAVNFAAIHTTSMAFTQILFDLASRPSYIAPLREEVENVIREEGLTKVSLYKMHKLDSFIKESQRVGGNGALVMGRTVLKDFTFSDGTVIPKGNSIAIASFSTHHDKENYAEPDKFDGFRFAHMRDSENESFNKHQMVSVGPDYVVFGLGRHACPGRFFAVNELKAILAHVLLTYDVAIENGGPRPEDVWFASLSVPDPKASVMFRKRRT